jgi:phosphatidylserine/phosphatidylglycerophosphate/cardiolipin synthase-like enzyme
MQVRPSETDLWPPNLAPDFTDVPVAVSRTIPASGGEPEIREIKTLTDDALRAARHSIYIEAQYFADAAVGDLLETALRQEHGPEIVLLTVRSDKGFLERWAMGSNRDRLIRRLRRADRFGRFRAFYPVLIGPDGDREIFVHSKLMVIDDRLLRLGSANLNRRSTGLDTECDLSIEAGNEDIEPRQAIARIRNALLSEHLGVAPAKLAAAVRDHRSLIRALESLNNGQRRLRPFDHVSDEGPIRLMPGSRLLDPAKPFPLGSLLSRRARRHVRRRERH